MTTKFLIIPTIAENFEQLNPDFHLEIEHFRSVLSQRWAIFVPKSEESDDHDFEWSFAPDGASWCIYFDRSIIRFRWDEFAKDFVLWYRSYIPFHQRLFLVFEGGGDIEITGSINSQAIEDFAHGK